MAYITRDGSPTSTTTYATTEEAVASIANAIHVRANIYKSWGIFLTVEEGENPAIARREARAALQTRKTAPAWTDRRPGKNASVAEVDSWCDSLARPGQRSW